MRRFAFALSAGLLLVLAPDAATAQLLGKPSKPSASSAADAGTTAVSPTSPRASLQEFLRLAKAEEWSAAAEYLAVTGANREQASTLARHLKVVLDQRIALNLENVSPLATGDTTDGDVLGDRLGLIAGVGGREDPVRLVRLSGTPPHWVFSEATVAAIPSWYENLGASWLRDRLPAALMREGPFHVFIWQWIGLALTLPVLFLFSWLVGGSLRSVFTRLAARTTTDWDDLLVEHLRGPFRLWISAIVATPLLGVLELNARVAEFAHDLTRGLVLLALFWGLLRVIRLGQHRLENAAWESGQAAQARTLVPLLGNLLRVTLAIVALLVALSQFGYPVGTLLAGLGIGGIAVALAAQKTVEHLFGSVSLAADKVFRVGDWVRAGTTEGTVERIGLRSTSFRTNDRTVVRVPNGRLADERIETFGERDRMFFKTDIDLPYTTPADRIDAIRDQLEALLRNHPLIWPDAVRVNVIAFTDSAIRMHVQAWFQTTDWGEFLTLRHRLLLSFIRVLESNETSFAFPSRTIYHVTQDGGPPPMAE